MDMGKITLIDHPLCLFWFFFFFNAQPYHMVIQFGNILENVEQFWVVWLIRDVFNFSKRELIQ